MDFSKVKEAIIKDYEKHYLFSHCVLSNLILPELTTLILNDEFNDMKNHLLNINRDECLSFGMIYLIAANCKKSQNEPFGFNNETYLGQLTSEVLDFFTTNINHLMMGDNKIIDNFIEDIQTKYDIDTIVKHYNAIPVDEILEIKKEIRGIEHITEMLNFTQPGIKKYFKTDKKYLDLIIPFTTY